MEPTRIDFVEATNIGTAAFRRATAARCSAGDKAVLFAVDRFTTGYRKLWDRVYVGQLAELVGMHPDNVGRHLRNLHEARIIAYNSSPVKGSASFVAIVVEVDGVLFPRLDAGKVDGSVGPKSKKVDEFVDLNAVWVDEMEQLGRRFQPNRSTGSSTSPKGTQRVPKERQAAPSGAPLLDAAGAAGRRGSHIYTPDELGSIRSDAA